MEQRKAQLHQTPLCNHRSLRYSQPHTIWQTQTLGDLVADIEGKLTQRADLKSLFILR